MTAPKLPEVLTPAQIGEAHFARFHGDSLTDIAKRFGVTANYLFTRMYSRLPNIARMNQRQRKIYEENRRLAFWEIKNAVRHGKLPHLKKTIVMCVDCKVKRATSYDHRDYAKPLEVSPVCGRCNCWRGHAKIPE